MGKKKKKKKGYNNYRSNETALALVNAFVNDNESIAKANTKKYSGNYNKPNFDRKGKKNETKFPDFIKLCKFKQEVLKDILMDELLKEGYEVNYGDGYLYAKGDIPVLLTAHMDTVHKTPVIDFYEYYDKENNRHIISSPQGIGGDDRCGIYMILEIIKTHKCSVLFCEDEEIGGIGSDKFCKTNLIYDLSELKYLIELDRMNGNDAVFYDCDNAEFEDFITTFTEYKTAWGSFSDISNLAPYSGVAAVNLSCGYYNAHTTSEYVVIEEMMNTIEVVKMLLNVECEQFEYIEYDYGAYASGYSYENDSNKGCHDLNDEDDFYTWCQEQKAKKLSTTEKEERSLVITLNGVDKSETVMYVSNGTSINEAFGSFFIDNPSYCFNDIVDYEFYESKVYEDGWYTTRIL